MKSTLAMVQRPGSLRQERSSQTLIPKTICDAMALTELLDERYLWADMICICQDDDVAKHREINRMDEIYAGAILTIIAADGTDADAGLRGFRNSAIPVPRSFKHKVIKFGIDEELVSVVPLYFNSGPWAERAWTFQEDLFSRRQIVFGNDSVIWECPQCIWREDMTADLNPTSANGAVYRQWTMYANSRLSLLPRSDVLPGEAWQLEELINYCNVRDLSFPEDALNAFAGAMSTWSRWLAGGVLSGLPAAFFHVALLWENFGPGKRRYRKSKSANACLPSWSWAGWCCELQKGPWMSIQYRYPRVQMIFGQTSLFQTSKEAIDSSIQWSYHLSEESPAIAINNSWKKLQSYRDNDEMQCPPGWRRESLESFEGSQTENRVLDPVKKWIYSHKDAEDLGCEFPFPLRTPNDHDKNLIFAPFISCKTRRGWLSPVRQSSSEVSDLSDEPGDLLLYDSADGLAGQIQSCEYPWTDSESKRKWWIKQKVELIELSTGRLLKESSMSDETIDTSFSPYECYHVMWIEWNDKIAYRKGIGRVYKQIWEAMDLEPISVMLG
jgi:hypothetical protein